MELSSLHPPNDLTNLSTLVIELKTKARLLGALACTVFVISIFTPFLQAVWQGGIIGGRPGPETYWSFKGTIETIYPEHGRTVREYWLTDYWFHNRISQYEGLGPLIEPALTLTLTCQILVLIFAKSAILLNRSQLFLGSITLNAIALFCMLLITYALYHEYERHLVAGFWLALLATALFGAALYMSRKT